MTEKHLWTRRMVEWIRQVSSNLARCAGCGSIVVTLTAAVNLDGGVPDGWLCDACSEPCDQESIEQVRQAAAGLLRPDAVDRWLDAPNDVLDGATPNDLIRAGQEDRVLDLLDALAEGVTS